MKRDHNQAHVGRHSGNIRQDLSHDQLATIGGIALAYNDLEGCIDELFFAVSALPKALRLEISTRINGIEGKIEIIKCGAALAGLVPEDQKQLAEALGRGERCFMNLKSYRDAVIHCRVINSIASIGLRTDRRAKLIDVLLTKDALEYLYQGLVSLRSELREAETLINTLRRGRELGDPKKQPPLRDTPRTSARFRARRTRRRSVQQPPEFPSEHELREALNKVLHVEALAYYQQQSARMQARGDSKVRRYEAQARRDNPEYFSQPPEANSAPQIPRRLKEP